METIEKRRQFLTNAAYFAVLLVGYYLFIKYAFWLFFPFLFAFFIAALLQKPIRFCAKKTPLKPGALSALFVLGFLVVAGLLIFLIGSRLAEEFRGLWRYLSSLLNDLPANLQLAEEAILKALGFLPESLRLPVGTAITGFVENLIAYLQVDAAEAAGGAAAAGEAASAEAGGLGFSFSWLKTPLSGLWATAKQIPSLMIATVITLISCILISSEYDWIVGFIRRQLPEEKRGSLSIAKRIVFSSLGKLGKSYLTIMFITFCEMAIGLNLLRLFGAYKSGYIIPTAIIIAVVDILPVLGTGTVVIPWAIYALVTRQAGLGIGLLVIYAIITGLRQFIEPKLVASNLGLPAFLTIMGMYVGLQLFGFIGLFLVPITLILIKVLHDEGVITLWKPGPPKEEPKKKKALVKKR